MEARGEQTPVLYRARRSLQGAHPETIRHYVTVIKMDYHKGNENDCDFLIITFYFLSDVFCGRWK